MLQNSVVYTPYDRKLYYVTGFHVSNANAPWHLKDGSVVSYKRYFKTSYSLRLTFEYQPLLAANGLFTVRNFLHKCYEKVKGCFLLRVPIFFMSTAILVQHHILIQLICDQIQEMANL
uniref:PAZ domain-containing protein n=1 Tax=Arundo donax TaxID=35708 RepID=A0A0A9CD00_ARUDO